MGTGRLDGDRFNLIVSFRHDADPARIAEWRASFEQASRLLFEATNGQHQIGNVFVCPQSAGGRDADAWLLAEDGRSVSNLKGLGTPGAHMTLYGDERFKPYIIVHELSHYVYGVYDEYSGTGGEPAECVGGTTGDACIMEAAWSDGDRFGDDAAGGALVPGRVRRFCTASDHDPDHDTEQESVNHSACWGTMVTTFPGLTIPPDAFGAPDGADSINWVVLAAEQRYALVLDRSGSMAGNKLEQTRIGGAWWADVARMRERLAVVSFADEAREDLPLLTITGGADRDTAHAAVDAIAAGGQTAIGDGLRAGLDALLSPGTRAATQVLILLTDGLSNAGEAPEDVLPDLVANGVRVYTIAVGVSVDTALLQRIADATGGTFRRVDATLSPEKQALQVTTYLQEISGVARPNGGIVTSRPEPFAEGRRRIERTVSIEDGSESATFVISWLEPDARLELVLRSPDGEVIGVDSFPPTVRQIHGPQPYMAFEVERPAAGSWDVAIVSADAATPVNAQFMVFSDHPRIDGTLTAAGGPFAPGDVVELRLQAYCDQPITDVQVSGVARLPDGSTAPLRFDDTGDRARGDMVARDGLFTARFDETHGAQGTYAFSVDVECDGTAATYATAGELLLAAEQFTYPPIPTFRRRFTTAVVIGVEPIESRED
jgi:uncharacterized protein YegL